jgi:SPP1 gp7 family putative phage head morphogenesis protein
MPTKSQYIRNQEIIRNRLAKLYVAEVYAALQGQIAAAVEVVKREGVHSAASQIPSVIMNDKVASVVLALYQTAANQAAKKYKPNIKGFGFDQVFINSVLKYLQDFLLSKVVAPITNTTIAFIDAVLKDAIKEGWGVDETVKHLEKSDITKNRAKMIVRTETVRATNYTQLAAADSEDFEMEKSWIAIEDKRTRRSHSHAGVDGERVPLYEPYSNGLMFPGDPNGDAASVVNCRCTQGYFAARDLSGNLIPKKNKNITIMTALSMRHAA